MVSQQTLTVAKQAADELRGRGEVERAEAIEALLAAAREESIPALDLLTSAQAGNIFGVSGQTIKNWVRQKRIAGYRVGGRIMVPRAALEDYVRRAGSSLDLGEISDEEAAALVLDDRKKR